MRERPSWLKVVGGKDHKPADSPTAKEEVVPAEHAPEVSFGELVGLWIDVTNNLPADLLAKINPKIQSENAAKVKSWTVPQLHQYLSRPDIWQRPSFTQAVIEEVRARMMRHNFSPR